MLKGYCVGSGNSHHCVFCLLSSVLFDLSSQTGTFQTQNDLATQCMNGKVQSPMLF